MNVDDEFVPKPRKPKKVRETGRGGVEQTGRQRVRERGGESLKWVSPGHNGVPDQIELYGADPMVAWLLRNMVALVSAFESSDPLLLRRRCEDLLAEAIQFTEYKAPGKAPSSNQLREHVRLRARGFTVNVVDQKLQ
jgi:hypothetical protein